MNISDLTTIQPYTRDCHDPEKHMIEFRFWFVAVCGTFIATVAIILNLFLFLLFITNRTHRSSSSFYLLLLSFFDVFMGISYIMVMSIRIFVNYYENVYLKKIWMSYVVYMMTISHIAMTASSFLIVFATFERYLITIGHNGIGFLQTNRKILAMLGVMFGFLSKITIFFEINVLEDTDCIDHFNQFYLSIPEFVLHDAFYYKTVWKFYYRNIATIFLPFFLLMIFNFGILNALRQSDANNVSSLLLSKETSKARKIRIRAATRTTVLVGLTYLASNALNIFITFWEHIDIESLTSNKFLDFYLISVDAVSVLTVIASALRIVIYVSCQQTMRHEIKSRLTMIWKWCTFHPQSHTSFKNDIANYELKCDEVFEEQQPVILVSKEMSSLAGIKEVVV
uniref:G_PROTEIN_RECEP_F1_2 domain-containing protein n=1 Tax=Rhabditophanes sp. KR3021 TaxID=114890 RepID=A0AC35TU60_9BILA